MIVNQTGYKTLAEVQGLTEPFGIYRTKKNTLVLVQSNCLYPNENLYYPKKDRLPWKDEEGKKISLELVRVFDSKSDDVSTLDCSEWNGGKQIMAYKEFCLWEYNHRFDKK